MKSDHPRFVAAAVTALALFLVWRYSLPLRLAYPYIPPVLVLATLMGFGALGANDIADFRFLRPSLRRVGFLLLAWIAFRIVVPHQAIVFDGPDTAWTETYCLGLPVAVVHTPFVVAAYLVLGRLAPVRSRTERRVELRGEDTPRPL